MRRGWRGPVDLAAAKILLRKVKRAQSGTPIQRSVCCKVETPTGRSIFPGRCHALAAASGAFAVIAARPED
jgi:hypothetical protein